MIEPRVRPSVRLNGRRQHLRRRWQKAVAVLLTIAAMGVLGAPAGAAAPLSISIVGNHFVNGDGQTIRLLGVNHASFEYACVQGNGPSEGHMDDADAAAIASWGANAVRIPLNEDCWLGLNGQPSGGTSVTEYRQAVASYVAALNAHGLYAILDLHWSAPSTKLANGQQPMPDDHSPAFWSSVAAAFKGNPAVVFDAFNEPYSPGDPRSGDDPLHPVSWSCWRDGGCTVPYYEETANRTATTYKATGMQSLVDAIRAAGATQPVMVGGLDYANDLTGWMANRPADPLNQIAASFHNYQGKTCDNVGCWESQIAPVAASVPVVTGEFDQDVCGPSNFDNEYMTWADAHGVGYLAWGWWVLTPQEIADAGCKAFYLLSDWNGTPAAPNGTNLREHLLALGGKSAGAAPVSAPPAPAPTKFKLTKFKATVLVGGKVSFLLESAQACRAAIAGKTVKPFSLGGHKPRKLNLGSGGINLKPNKPATVTIKLPKEVAQLLREKGSLTGRFTVALSSGQASTFSQHTVTLKPPKPKPKKH